MSSVAVVGDRVVEVMQISMHLQYWIMKRPACSRSFDSAAAQHAFEWKDAYQHCSAAFNGVHFSQIYQTQGESRAAAIALLTMPYLSITRFVSMLLKLTSPAIWLHHDQQGCMCR